MPLQNYSINTPDAVAGQLYGLQQTRADIQTRLAAEPLDFGIAVTDAEGVSDRSVAPAAGGKVGITLRQINREQATRPGDGTVQYATGESVGVLFDGRVVVAIADIADAKKGDLLNVDAGQFVVGSGTATTNVRLDVKVAEGLYVVVVTN